MATLHAQEATSYSTFQCTYHVFLSFRGKDTRRTFTDHLYSALVHAGFRVFRDENEIERGENMKLEIEKAIEQSRSSIIVFSKGYASSRWCLDELVMIVERNRSCGHVILPIFYDLEPSEVRKQTGNVKEAFVRHEANEKLIDKLKGWREALTEVADLGGMNLQNQADRYESKFIQKIVKVIEAKLDRTVLTVTPYLVGIHSRVKSINLWLKDEYTDVGVAAICGMGGIGKTTVAKFIFNQWCGDFEGCSFIANVREASEQPNGLIHLQKQLISDILKRKKENICNVDEGIIKIRDAISYKRVLLVLDDVDREEQLNVIFGTQDFFCKGSKVIITTRNEGLLKAHSHGIYKLQKIDVLDNHEALELFSWHAFGQNHPVKDYKQQSEKVVGQCGGLPLALQVVGSSLSGKRLDIWRSAVEKLKAIPDSQILGKLKISYDSLQDDHDKNLFLDIACFFTGKCKDYVVTVLDECNFYTEIGIQNLLDRCLLKIDEDNKLVMHQLIRDMGREIIRQESPKDPGKRSRLWHHKDSLEVLREKTGMGEIEGLILDMNTFNKDNSAWTILSTNNSKKRSFDKFVDQKAFLSAQGNSLKRRHLGLFSWNLVNTFSRKSTDQLELKTDAFARMHKLRLLQLNHVQLSGGYHQFPKQLKWLCWHGFAQSTIPYNFPLESVVYIDMRYSKLNQVWKGAKFLGLLKILKLGHSHSLVRAPDFSLLPNLERLNLKDCPSLIELHESIGHLQRLVFLNLKDCINLRKLPQNIAMLRLLETLLISGCSNLEELPIQLSKMESLKVFHADGITINRLLAPTSEVESWEALRWYWLLTQSRTRKVSWTSLPRFLVSLSLVNCDLSNDDFPKDFNSLSSLKHLNLSKNPITSLPDCIRGICRLHTLRLNSCTRLKSLVGLPSVDKLFVGHCTLLEKITYLSSLFKPQQIEHTECAKLDQVEGLIKLEPLTQVYMEMIKHLNLINLEVMGNIEVNFFNGRMLNLKMLPIQGLDECGVFSTFFPGREIPSLFNIRSPGSPISFTVPSLPNHRILGFNICSVYTLLNKDWLSYSIGPDPLLRAEVSNNSKNLKWKYCPTCLGIPEASKSLIWFSHWNVRNHFCLEDGDEVRVSVDVNSVFKLNEFGIQVVYEEKERKDGQLNIHPSTQDLSGTNFSAYQVRTGVYYVSNQLLSRDDILLPTPSSRWAEDLLPESLQTTDEEELQNGDIMVAPKGAQGNSINEDQRGQFIVVSHFLSKSSQLNETNK